jgi:hypothetical protein
MPPVPINPEPLPALRARWKQALAHVYDQMAIVEGGGIRPGEVAAQVFDALDGLRLIVSRERVPEGRVVLHVSASFPSTSRIADEFRLLASLRGSRGLFEMWLRSIPERFGELCGDPALAGRLQYIGMQGSQVPHWVIEGEVPDVDFV